MSEEAKTTTTPVSTKLLITQAVLYTTIGALTPAVNVLAGSEPFTTRAIIALAVTCTIAGATALKAFLSTSLADSGGSKPTP